jgi:hypothetical protein
MATAMFAKTLDNSQHSTQFISKSQSCTLYTVSRDVRSNIIQKEGALKELNLYLINGKIDKYKEKRLTHLTRMVNNRLLKFALQYKPNAYRHKKTIQKPEGAWA